MGHPCIACGAVTKQTAGMPRRIRSSGLPNTSCGVLRCSVTLSLRTECDPPGSGGTARNECVARSTSAASDVRGSQDAGGAPPRKTRWPATIKRPTRRRTMRCDARAGSPSVRASRMHYAMCCNRNVELLNCKVVYQLVVKRTTTVLHRRTTHNCNAVQPLGALPLAVAGRRAGVVRSPSLTKYTALHFPVRCVWSRLLCSGPFTLIQAYASCGLLSSS